MQENKEVIDLNNDLMFKCIFEQKKYAKYLIKYLFDEEVDILEIISDKMSISTMKSKKSFFDIFIITSKTIYIVEMQNRVEENLEERTFYYSTTSSNEILKKGEQYSDLKNIKIGFICNFKINSLKDYKNTFKISCRNNFDIYYNFFESKYVDLFKINQCIDEEEKIFFNFIKGVYTNSPLINQIKKEMIKFSNNEEWRNMNRDFLSSYNTAIRVGTVRGLEQGMKEGKQQTILSTIEMLKKMNLTKTQIIEKIVENYDLDEEFLINLVCASYQAN